MSDQSKHYDYYMAEGEDVKALIAGYDSIREQRNNALQKAASQVGAVAWTTSRCFGGGGGLLDGFAWEKGFEFPCPMTIKREEMFDGKRIVLGRGKGNTKEGRAYNKVLDAVKLDANTVLKNLPEWRDYIINHFGVMRTGIGAQAERGYGFAMLTSYAVRVRERDDCLVLAIPNGDDGWHGEVVIPDNFQKLTYGQFYDIVNSESETAA